MLDSAYRHHIQGSAPAPLTHHEFVDTDSLLVIARTGSEKTWLHELKDISEPVKTSEMARFGVCYFSTGTHSLGVNTPC